MAGKRLKQPGASRLHRPFVEKSWLIKCHQAFAEVFLLSLWYIDSHESVTSNLEYLNLDFVGGKANAKLKLTTKNAKLVAVGDGSLFDVHEVFQHPVLFGIRKLNLI